jgi:hypothetical protein
VAEKEEGKDKGEEVLLDAFSMNWLKETVIVISTCFMNHSHIRCKKEHPV